MHLRKLLSLLTLAAALLAPAAANAATITPLGGPTAVREYDGTLVFSQYDAATKQYTLMTRAPGQAPAPVPGVEPADRDFDADIGTDSSGKPELIYTRCDETCDLFVYSLTNDTGERAVRNANDPENNDTTPTLWRGRIAWARIYGEQIDRKVVVYTKKLSTPRSTPSTRLPGVPENRCGDVDTDTCGKTNGRTVFALELYGKNLGQTVSYGCGGCSGTSQAELRLVDVNKRTSKQVVFQVVGLSGQSLIGPSFHNGTLSWYRACLGDPAACQGGKAYPYRYEIGTGRGFRAPGGPVRLDGYADTGSVLYEVAGCNFETAGDFNKDCRLDEVPAPSFSPSSLPKR
jgi:hypothetical protein